MESPLNIIVDYNRESFEVTLKYDATTERLVHYVLFINEVMRKAELPVDAGIVLFTRTIDRGLVPIYEENYKILVETRNLMIDVDGAILKSIVTYFDKLYVLKPRTKPDIFPMETLLAQFSDELTKIIAYSKDPSPSSIIVPHINDLTRAEAELYLTCYFNYYGVSSAKLSEILDGNFFGVMPKKNVNDAYAIYMKDSFLDNALFNAIVKEGSVEKFEQQRSKFKMTSLLLSADEIRACFLKRYPDWMIDGRLNIKMGRFINDAYFGIPKDPEERKTYFATHDIGFLTHECINDINSAALSILNQTKDGDRLVIFGNSPFFVGRALKSILSRVTHIKRVLIEFPFSGAPNGSRGIFQPKNIVTPSRLAHLRTRLRRNGLSSQNPALLENDTYFIDVVGMGSGFVFVAEEILRDFRESGLADPNLKLITMNRIDINNKLDNNHEKIAKENPDENRHTILYFPSIKNTRFVTTSKEAYVKCHMKLDMLDDNDLRGYPEYNASFWQDEYDYLLEQRYSNAMQILLDYFDQNILSCQSCGNKENLRIEGVRPYGIYCNTQCQHAAKRQ